MPTYAPGTPIQVVDGIPYCTNAAIPTTEGDLAKPISVAFNEAVLAVVVFNLFNSAQSYIVMQTSVDGGANWVDVAWAVTTSNGVLIFVLSGGVAGANSFQQTRTAGTVPATNTGSNQIPLGGLIRFVGKSTAGSSSLSSSSSGPSLPGIRATISVKQLGLR